MVYGLIPAAGKGVRMLPLTDEVPKPLIKVYGKPMIEYSIDQLKNMGVEEIVVALHYKKDEIRDYLESKDFGVDITFSYPDKLLGLAYSIYSAKDIIDDTFVVHLPDNIFTQKCRYALDAHHKEGASVTMIVERGDPEGRYETLKMNGNVILDIIEKADVSFGYRGTGIYIFEPSFFEYCRAEECSERGEFELQTVIKRMIGDGKKVVGIEIRGGRLEITTKDDIDMVENKLGLMDTNG